MFSSCKFVTKCGRKIARGNTKRSVRLYATPQLISDSFHKLFLKQVDQYPHKDCVVFPELTITYSYQEALDHVCAYSAGLLEACGFKRSSSGAGTAGFATSLPNRLESVLAQPATSSANIEWAPLAPILSAADLKQQVETVQPGLLVWSPKVGAVTQLDAIYDAFPILERIPRHQRLNLENVPTLRHVLQTSRRQLDGLIQFKSLLVYDNSVAFSKAVKQVDIHQPQTIMLNDQLQQVLLTPYSIINTGYVVGSLIQASAEDRVACIVPLHQSAGVSLGFPLTLSHQARLDLLSESFSPEEFPNLLSSHKTTILILKPSQLAELLPYLPETGKSKNVDVTSLKSIVVTSSPGDMASAELLQKTSTTLGSNTNIYVTFGTNETTGIISITKANKFSDNFVGEALPHTEIKVLDNAMKAVPPNTPGTLYVKGFNTLHSFKNNPQLTKQKLQNGWLNTGVSAKLQPSGLVIL